jgi:CubicO group peptidase (beta-lactamase class C family)
MSGFQQIDFARLNYYQHEKEWRIGLGSFDVEGLIAWLDDRAERHEFSGVATAWMAGGPVFLHAAGVAHRGLRVPMRGDNRFRVASITKMITATAVMRLVERGELSLGTPVIDLLDSDARPASVTSAMTVHHLLSHTSGLANYHDEDDETFDAYMAGWDVVPPHRAREPEDLLPLFAHKSAHFAPGSSFSYGDVNYIMLGMILSAVTSSTFRSVATDEVLIPAGMSSSGFDDLDADPPDLAVGYQVSDAPAALWPTNAYANPVGGMPDGGLIATASDLCRFIDAFRSGRLVTEETRARMLTSYGRINDDLEHYGYGMEMWIDERDEVRIFGHAGGDPGVSGMVSHFVDGETTIVVLCNYDRGSWTVSRQVAEVLGVDEPRK